MYFINFLKNRVVTNFYSFGARVFGYVEGLSRPSNSPSNKDEYTYDLPYGGEFFSGFLGGQISDGGGARPTKVFTKSAEERVAFASPLSALSMVHEFVIPLSNDHLDDVSPFPRTKSCRGAEIGNVVLVVIYDFEISEEPPSSGSGSIKLSKLQKRSDHNQNNNQHHNLLSSLNGSLSNGLPITPSLNSNARNRYGLSIGIPQISQITASAVSPLTQSSSNTTDFDHPSFVPLTFQPQSAPPAQTNYSLSALDNLNNPTGDDTTTWTTTFATPPSPNCNNDSHDNNQNHQQHTNQPFYSFPPTPETERKPNMHHQNLWNSTFMDPIQALNDVENSLNDVVPPHSAPPLATSFCNKAGASIDDQASPSSLLANFIEFEDQNQPPPQAHHSSITNND